MSILARRMADSLIKKHGVRPPVPIVEIALQEGTYVDYDELDDQVSGLLVTKEKEAHIIVNKLHAETRQRFTIGHELGHFLLHRHRPSVFVDDYLVHFREDLTAKRYDRRETQANVFAATLLLPVQFLREDLAGRPIDVSDDEAMRKLAQKYLVSPLALSIRLANLGLARGLPALARSPSKK